MSKYVVERNPLETPPKFQAVSGDRLLFGRPEKFDRQFFILMGAEGAQTLVILVE
jgi:hypothetical protein